MHRHSHRLISLILFAMILLLAFGFARRVSFRETITSVCSVTVERILSPEVLSSAWINSCYADAGRIYGWESKKVVIQILQARLNEIGLSHLGVYGPTEEQLLWQGRARENGLRTWAINGRFVTSEVIRGSPAETAGVRVGDEVVKINGQHPLTHWQVRSSQGEFIFGRNGQDLSVGLETKSIVIDDKPFLKRLSAGVGVLRLSSFRAELFEFKEWQALSNQLAGLDGLIVDLRDNSGGNVVAMLRALSSLICQDHTLGYFIRSRAEDTQGPPFTDDLSDNVQINHLQGYGRIPIRRFQNYRCFQGSMVVLTSDKTSSVAEMLASILIEERKISKSSVRTELLGSATAGDVLLAIWYPLPNFGKGYSFSVPEATYQTNVGEVLEGVGVRPKESISYDLDEALQGKDSGIEKALKIIEQSLL